jgi:hypothetical protein
MANSEKYYRELVVKEKDQNNQVSFQNSAVNMNATPEECKRWNIDPNQLQPGTKMYIAGKGQPASDAVLWLRVGQELCDVVSDIFIR